MSEALPISRQQIDQICDDFEQAFSAGLEPSLEDYLAKVSDEQAKPLFAALLQVEAKLLRSAGGRPDWSAYRDRFPE